MQLGVVELSETNAGEDGLQDKALVQKVASSLVNTIAHRSILQMPHLGLAPSLPGTQASVRALRARPTCLYNKQGRSQGGHGRQLHLPFFSPEKSFPHGKFLNLRA